MSDVEWGRRPTLYEANAKGYNLSIQEADAGWDWIIYIPQPSTFYVIDPVRKGIATSPSKAKIAVERALKDLPVVPSLQERMLNDVREVPDDRH